MNNKTIQNIIKQIKEIHTGNLWIGTNFNQKTDTVSDKDAFFQPHENLHNIAEIISHLLVWRKVVILRIKTGKGNLIDENKENWENIEYLKKIGWIKLRDDYYKSLDDLISLLESKEDTFLKEIYYDSDYEKAFNFQFILEGMIHHDTYHLGQIGIVLKLVNPARSRKIMENISFHRITSTDTALILLIADWYLKEWNIPADITVKRIESFPVNGIPFQIIMKLNNIPIATGGMYDHVGLLDVEPRFKVHSPWLALVYTVDEMRNKGYGALLCNQIERVTKESGIDKTFLFTHTAESLYQRLEWKPFERLSLKGKNIVVMEKKSNCHDIKTSANVSYLLLYLVRKANKIYSIKFKIKSVAIPFYYAVGFHLES